MGRDKLMLEVGGVPLIRRVGGALSARCDEIVVVGGGAARIGGLRRVSDKRYGLGPLAGMEAGLAAARNRLVFVAAGDMPFLPVPLIGYLLERLSRRHAAGVVPRYGGRPHPLCAAYDRAILPQVESALDRGVRSVRGLLRCMDSVEYVERELRRFGDPDLYLMNVNTPEDLERARASMEGTP
jgi:molybdopterin-guanine dinucleotide biosynthesis protein A